MKVSDPLPLEPRIVEMLRQQWARMHATDAFLNGAVIEARIVMTQHTHVSGDLVGVPDLLCFRQGVTMLIECKRKGGKMRDSQKKFAEEISIHLRSTLWLVLADDVDDLIRKVEQIETMAR